MKFQITHLDLFFGRKSSELLRLLQSLCCRAFRKAYQPQYLKLRYRTLDRLETASPVMWRFLLAHEVNLHHVTRIHICNGESSHTEADLMSKVLQKCTNTEEIIIHWKEPFTELGNIEEIVSCLPATKIKRLEVFPPDDVNSLWKFWERFPNLEVLIEHGELDEMMLTDPLDEMVAKR